MITKKIKITAGAFALMALFPFKVYASDAYDIVFNQALVLRPVTVAMAVTGAVISYGNPDDVDEKMSRKRVLWGIVWSSFMALVLTSVGLDFMGWDWADKRQGPIAGLLAVSLRVLWPIIKSAVPGFLLNWGKRLAPRDGMTDTTDTSEEETQAQETNDDAK